MHKIERLAFWAVLVAIALVTAVNYGGIQDLRQAVLANTTDLDKPELEVSVLPGVPGEFRTAWRAAKNNAQDSGLTDQLWLTVRLSNEGAARAGDVAAELSLVDRIERLFVYTAEAETFETAPYGRPSLAAGGPGEASAAIEFNGLEPGQSHLVFVGVRPDSFDGAPYDRVDYVVWLDEAAQHWNAVRVTSASESPAAGRVTVTEYGIGPAGVSVTTKRPGSVGKSG